MQVYMNPELNIFINDSVDQSQKLIRRAAFILLGSTKVGRIKCHLVPFIRSSENDKIEIKTIQYYMITILKGR